MLHGSASRADSASLPADTVRSEAFIAMRSTSACAAAVSGWDAACLSFTSRERFSSCKYNQVKSFQCMERYICLQHQDGMLLASASRAESASLPASTARLTAFIAPKVQLKGLQKALPKMQGENRESCLPQCCQQHTSLLFVVTPLRRVYSQWCIHIVCASTAVYTCWKACLH